MAELLPTLLLHKLIVKFIVCRYQRERPDNCTVIRLLFYRYTFLVDLLSPIPQNYLKHFCWSVISHPNLIIELPPVKTYFISVL